MVKAMMPSPITQAAKTARARANGCRPLRSAWGISECSGDIIEGQFEVAGQGLLEVEDAVEVGP